MQEELLQIKKEEERKKLEEEKIQAGEYVPFYTEESEIEKKPQKVIKIKPVNITFSSFTCLDDGVTTFDYSLDFFYNDVLDFDINTYLSFTNDISYILIMNIL